MFKKSETVVTTPEDVLQLLQPMASAFPDLYRFIQLVVTFPVSPADAERSFSCLKRVKTPEVNHVAAALKQPVFAEH